MNTNNKTKWVIGHKITPVDVSGNYDMVMGTTPAKMQGPPPHHHNGFNEVFLVIEGTMDFLVDGKPIRVQAGDSVDLPPGKVHTFQNNSDVECKWVNIHSPKGFYDFFDTMGVSADENNALEKSLDQSIINKVIETAADYDMIIDLPPQ